MHWSLFDGREGSTGLISANSKRERETRVVWFLSPSGPLTSGMSHSLPPDSNPSTVGSVELNAAAVDGSWIASVRVTVVPRPWYRSSWYGSVHVVSWIVSSVPTVAIDRLRAVRRPGVSDTVRRGARGRGRSGYEKKDTQEKWEHDSAHGTFSFERSDNNFPFDRTGMTNHNRFRRQAKTFPSTSAALCAVANFAFAFLPLSPGPVRFGTSLLHSARSGDTRRAPFGCGLFVRLSCLDSRRA